MKRTAIIGGQEYEPPVYPADALSGVAYVALHAIAAVQTAEGDPQANLDTGLSVESMAYLIAAILESLPELKTNRDLRAISESVGAMVHGHLRDFRRSYEETGVHPIAGLGAAPMTSSGTVN
ncbi:MAG: hypothetical protein JWQ16_1720 [Novosphingobium sp.]|nr:hypothetical protein [Novosphingobium sp.]